MSDLVSLFIFDYSSLAQEQLELFAQNLGRNQQAKLIEINARKRNEFICSRALLSYCLNKIHSKKDQVWEIIERPQLPPHIKFADELNIRFSISHQQSMLGIAVAKSTKKLGFDIQQIKTFSSFQTALIFAGNFCSEPELKSLQRYVNEDLHRLAIEITRLWTLKEAFFKAQLCGIYNPNLKKTNFSVCTNSQAHGFSNHCFDSDKKHFQIAIVNETNSPIESYQVSILNEEFEINNLRFDALWQGFKNIEI